MALSPIGSVGIERSFKLIGPPRHLEGSADNRRAVFVSVAVTNGATPRFVLPSRSFGVANSEAATRYLF